MKKLLFVAVLITFITALAFVGCEKDVVTTPTTEMLSKKGGKNTSGSGSNSSYDSLLNYCGLVFTDTGSWYPTVNVNNIRWRHHTSYSSPTTTYDVLVIDFDVPTIPGKTVSSYILFADSCSGRPACTKMNGIYMSQVTAGYTYNEFWLPIGTSWLAPNRTYTGVICVVTSEGCMYLSQRFIFESPYIL